MVESVIQKLKATTDTIFTQLFEKAASLGSEVGPQIRKPRISGRQVLQSNPPSSSVDFMIQELTSRFSDPNPVICHLSTISTPIISEDEDVCTDEFDWTIGTDSLFTFLDAETEQWKAEWMGKQPASVQELYMVVILFALKGHIHRH